MATQVTLKEGASPEELDKYACLGPWDEVLLMYSSAKKTVEEQGGKITHTFNLIKGFT